MEPARQGERGGRDQDARDQDPRQEARDQEARDQEARDQEARDQEVQGQEGLGEEAQGKGQQGQAGRPRRDRDEAGRPRNARARDASGRPLPRGQAGEERVPDDLSLAPEAAVAEAQRLIDSGHPFHAHEVLEASWKADPGPERDLWQGLAQLAVGLTHAQRGNAHGAVALLRRGADRVRPFSAAAPYGIDVAGAVQFSQRLSQRIEDDGVDQLSPADLLLSLHAR